jgi:hypothetical protein
MKATMSDCVLGRGNGATGYALILLYFAALFAVMRYANGRVELNFRRSYWILFWGWGVGTFFGNYAFYRLGWMSFLPWLNNALHTFVWIGLCLGFLYAGSYRRRLLEQSMVFAIFSFLAKEAEHGLLGTWEFDRFFFIGGNAAYILGWSLMDGLYPVISGVALSWLARHFPGVVAPWEG